MKYVLCAIFLLACNLIYAGEYDGEISSYKNLLDGAKKGESHFSCATLKTAKLKGLRFLFSFK